MLDKAEMTWGRLQYDRQAGRGSLVVPDSAFADDEVANMACERGESEEQKIEELQAAEGGVEGEAEQHQPEQPEQHEHERQR